MHNRFFITTAIVFLVTIFFAHLAKLKNSAENEKRMHIVSNPGVIQREEVRKPIRKGTTEVKNLITESEIKDLRDKLPLKEDMKAEVREKPHQTPKSLVTFATALGLMSEKAFLNVTNADLFLDELDDCTSNDKIAESARALCLSKAEKTAQKFPTLKDKFNIIKERAPASIGVTVKRQKSLLKTN